MKAEEVIAKWPADFAHGWEKSLPANYELTAEMREFAMKAGLNAEYAFEEFLSESCAADKKFADWDAAFRVRVRYVADACSLLGLSKNPELIEIPSELRWPVCILASTLSESMNSSMETEEYRQENETLKTSLRTLTKERDELRAELTRLRRSIGAAYGQAKALENK